MYKVYLSPSTEKNLIGKKDYGYEEYRMNQIANTVEQELINKGTYIVFRNMEEMTTDEIIEDSNNIRPNLHIAFHTKSGEKEALQIEVNDNNEYSNALGKEIAKQIQNIYHTKSDNIIAYTNTKKEIIEISAPAVCIYLGCRNNIKDIEWIIDNIDKIGKSIACGIEEYFKLKKC